MLFRKLKEGTGIGFSGGATGAHRIVGARLVEHGCGSYFGSVKEKSNRSWVKGSPLMLPPLRGREGVTSQFPRQLKKKREDFP
jgi:hypothetical protein